MRPVRSILESQPWDVLRPLLPSTVRAEEAIGRLKRYAEMLLEWNHSVSNLISRHDEGRILQRHLRESLEPSRWIAEHKCQRWLDLGSGAGLPAIPLAIVGVGEHWTLVESRRTKTLFLRKAMEELEIRGVEVVLGRLEVLIETGALSRSFDGFTSRATMTLGPTLDLGSKIVRPDGYAFLWKGSRRSEELVVDRGWSDSWTRIEERPMGPDQTSVVCFKRIG